MRQRDCKVSGSIANTKAIGMVGLALGVLGADAPAALAAEGDIYNLGTLAGSDDSSQGFAINATGQVTGESFVLFEPLGHAFLYSGTPGSGGAMVDLGTLGGNRSS